MPRLPKFFPKTREKLHLIRTFEAKRGIKPRRPRILTRITARAAMAKRINRLHDEIYTFERRLSEFSDGIGLPHIGVNGPRPLYAGSLRESVFRICSRIVEKNRTGNETFNIRELNGKVIGEIVVKYNPANGETVITLHSQATLPQRVSVVIPPQLMRETREHFARVEELQKYMQMYREIWAPLSKKKE